MTRRLLSGFTLLVGLAGSLTAQEFELRCRGQSGDGLRIRRQGPNWRDPATGEMRSMLALRFAAAPGAAGADASGLQPGTCAWVDRPLNRGEPHAIWFEVPADPRDEGDAALAERRPSAGTIPPYLRDENHYWSFFSDGSGANQLTARRHQAWTPAGGGQVAVVAPPPVVASGTPIPAPASPTPSSAGGGPTRAGAGVGQRQAPPAAPPSPAQPRPPGGGQPQTPEGPGNRTLRGGSQPNTAARVSDAGLVTLRLRNVHVSPIADNVVFTFQARPNVRPHLEIVDPNGVREAWFVTTGAPAQGQYTFDYSQHLSRGHREAPDRQGLRPGTSYRYTITVNGSDGVPTERETGTFTTRSQTVIVRFARVRILNDSDSGSSGDLAFRFYVAPATAEEAQPECCQQWFGNRTWETGELHPLANTFEIPNAPNRIRIWVKGWDDDAAFSNSSEITEPQISSYFGEGGSVATSDWNFARAEFDVGANPTAGRVGYPFRLRSKDGHVFMFEIEGEVEVLRQ